MVWFATDFRAQGDFAIRGDFLVTPSYGNIPRLAGRGFDISSAADVCGTFVRAHHDRYFAGIARISRPHPRRSPCQAPGGIRSHQVGGSGDNRTPGYGTECHDSLVAEWQ